MVIKELILYSQDITAQASFYSNVLGFDVEHASDQIRIQIGATSLLFKPTTEVSVYHYCFLVPSHLFAASIEYLQSRMNVIKIEGERVVAHVEDWNSDSVYFYDGNGNIAEFIARYDLPSEGNGAFDISQIVNVNEIGMSSNDIGKINDQLEEKLGSSFYKGSKERFGTHGDENGLFLLVNNEIKKIWFPTQLPTQSTRFEAIVEVPKGLFHIEFANGRLKIENKDLI